MYTVKILSEAEFDQLPYKHAKTSLGLADAKSGVAYVRDTGYNDITKGTIDHELDELIAKVSPHEEDGIRYKNLASLGAGAGSGLLSSMVPALRNFSPLISAGVGAAVNKDKNYFQGALQGLAGGGAASGVGGGLWNTFKGINQPGGTFGNALSKFMPGVESGLLQYAGAVPGMKGVGTSNPVGKVAQWLSGGKGTGGVTTAATKSTAKSKSGVPTPGQINAPQLASQLAGKYTPGTASTAATGGEEVLSKFNLGDELKKGALSMGIAGLGDLFAPKVGTPDFSGITNELRNMVATGGEPVAKDLGMTELTRGLTTPLGTPPDSAFTSGDIYSDEQLAEDLKNFDNAWKTIRPGADYKNDAEYQRQRQSIIDDARIKRTAARDELSFEYTQQQLTQKYNYMVQALNLDQSQMGQYIQLAQMDINQLMLEYGVDVETATKFKEMFADLAQLAYTGGTPPTISITDLFNAAKA